MRSWIFYPLVILFLAGCSTKVLRPDLKSQITDSPQMVDFHDRWLLGFTRKTYTDPQKACASETAVQIRDFTSTEDWLIGLITLGIYLPATTEVWCVKESLPPKSSDPTSDANRPDSN